LAFRAQGERPGVGQCPAFDLRDHPWYPCPAKVSLGIGVLFYADQLNISVSPTGTRAQTFRHAVSV